MWIRASATLLWLTAFQTPVPKPDALPVPRVEIGVRVDRAPGVTEWRGIDRTDISSYAWIDASCAAGASAEMPAKAPMAGWRFSSAILKQDADFVWVNVEWQRQWTTTPTALTARVHRDQIVGRIGDRVELDRLAPEEAGGCAPAATRLEATITRVVPDRTGPARGGVGRGLPAAPKGADALQGVQALRPTPKFAADVWLVHTLPDGKEEVTPQRMAFGASGSAFSFPAVTIDTTRGPVSVTVNVTLSATIVGARPTELKISLSRQVDGAGIASPMRKATGSTDKVLPWPMSSAVLAFDLPSVMVTAGSEIVGHQFSLRVRVATDPSLLPEEAR